MSMDTTVEYQRQRKTYVWVVYRDGRRQPELYETKRLAENAAARRDLRRPDYGAGVQTRIEREFAGWARRY